MKAPQLTAAEVDKLLAAARLLQAHGQRWRDFAQESQGAELLRAMLAEMVTKGLLRAGEGIERALGLAQNAAKELGGGR